MKNILSMAAVVALLVLVTLASCKKDEPVKVDFNNATAQYVESFLGKTTDEFKKACEESGMMQKSSEEDMLSYENSINGIEAAIVYNNGAITEINYTKKGDKTANKSKYVESIEFLSNNNYAAFKGMNDGTTCFKSLSDYKSSLNAEINKSNAYFAKTASASEVSYDDKSFGVCFGTPGTMTYSVLSGMAMADCK